MKEGRTTNDERQTTSDQKGKKNKITLFRPEIAFHVDESHAELLVHLRLELEKPSAQPRLQARLHGHQLVRRRHGFDGAAAGAVSSLHLPEPPEQPLHGLDVVGAVENRGVRCSHGHRRRRHRQGTAVSWGRGSRSQA